LLFTLKIPNIERICFLTFEQQRYIEEQRGQQRFGKGGGGKKFKSIKLGSLPPINYKDVLMRLANEMKRSIVNPYNFCFVFYMLKL
jgi:hypothetical protein